MLRCDSISLEWQPARRREMRIHWIPTATEQGVANGGDHLSELFLRAILFKCCFCCSSNIIHQTNRSNRCSLMSARVGVNTNKLIIHTCANHLGGPPVSTSSCDIIVHLAGAMSGKNLTVRPHVRHQMMH